MQTGTLYIVATPIGNLGDITLRALEVLKSVDIIAAEDTRHTLKLLNHYDIKKPLLSYHEHSTAARGEEIAALLEEGKNVALVSDAGMPLISDPGAPLTALLAARGLPMTVVPGASAGLSALALSALPSAKFTFLGFLPRDKTRKAALEEACSSPHTVILYESPHQLKKTLQELAERIPGRRMALAKELTKVHERVWRTTVQEALAEVQSMGEVRGEYVLILEGKPEEKAEAGDEEIAACIRRLLEQGVRGKEAAARAAAELEIQKNRAYKIFLEVKENSLLRS